MPNAPSCRTEESGGAYTQCRGRTWQCHSHNTFKALSWIRWPIPLILAHGRQKQVESMSFKAGLLYIASYRPPRTTNGDPIPLSVFRWSLGPLCWCPAIMNDCCFLQLWFGLVSLSFCFGKAFVWRFNFSPFSYVFAVYWTPFLSLFSFGLLLSVAHVHH